MLVKKNNKKLLLTTACLVIYLLLGAVFLFGGQDSALAASGSEIAWGGQQDEITNTIKLTTTDPRIVIARIIQVFLGFLGIIALLLILYAGFVWMTSNGDESKIQKAKDTLKSAVIGLFIILSAFAVASFIIAKLLGSPTWGPGSGGGPGNVPFGNGAVGNCAIVDYYPVAGQRDVPRNSVVMVTFREAINFATVADTTNNIRSRDNFLLFNKCVATCDTNTGNGCDSCLVDATAMTTDGRNIVVMPRDYMGSASQNTDYFVVLKNAIRKASSSDSIFKSCTPDSAYWSFEVGTKLDLDPPQVKTKDRSGVFPLPDVLQDSSSMMSAIRATGAINVAAASTSLKLLRDAQVIATSTNGGAWSGIQASVSKDCEASVLRINLSTDLVSSLTRISDGAPMGSGVMSTDKRTINFSYCGLRAVINSGDFDTCNGTPYSNCNWNIDITPYQEPDQLVIDGSIYTFVSSGSGASRIVVTGAVNATNVASAIRAKFFPNVDVAGALTNVTVTAKVAGLAGNRIVLSSNRADIFTFANLSGGQDLGFNTVVNGEKDEPRNSIIKINFNDQMLPITISGDAVTLQNKIFVQCLSISDCTDPNYFFDCNGGNRCVRGTFMVSNQYQTVEFQSNNKCGVNGCGEDIYCLPAGSNLRVGLKAANLFTCNTDSDCTSRSPYNRCVGTTVRHCQNADGVNYPLSTVAFDGLMDKARNSLDGSRDTRAVGPISFYNDNEDPSSPTNSGMGDDFEWSFYISDQLDITPPIIDAILPNMGDNNTATTAPVTVDFNKIMMSSSLMPGYRMVYSSNEEGVKHKTLNLWAKSGYPIGYWVTNNDESGSTIADINHSYFADYVSYRSQAGSGVKDIYQNCFKPSAGPSCVVNFTNPSCCNGVASSTLDKDGNCTN